MALFSFKQGVYEKYGSLLNAINKNESNLETLNNIELRERVIRLQQQIKTTNPNNLESIIEGFSLVREASKRTLGLRQYDTQILGGLVLNEGKIAEMKTGEGKTLVATAPAFFNALEGKGSHIVTVNDYLAKRDSEYSGQVMRFLGLNVGLVTATMPKRKRKEQYKADVTYITNNELGFDFLRDNMATQIQNVVQRPFNFCIIDEVDSILIDEARTPLIISGESNINNKKYFDADEIAKYLEEKQDFEIDEKSKSVSLTNRGFRKVEFLLNKIDIYAVKNPWIPYIINALKARVLFLRDINYIVRNNEIIIIDEFTGRIMEGRKWSDGLHQAIEAKEGIQSLKETETLASITYQNFFSLYPKISGMTGTAKTEELEFENIYNLSVTVLPTNKPMQRVDLTDLIYIDEISKWRAVVKECVRMYEIGRPVLVGTTTIQNSELLSYLLNEYKIPHQLLNAKPENIKQEAQIIAQAGCLKSITIATNMAGRGTDIMLGGNPAFKARQDLQSIINELVLNKKLTFNEINFDQQLLNYLLQYKSLLNYLKQEKNLKLFLNSVDIPNRSLNEFENCLVYLYKALLTYHKNICVEEGKKVKTLGGLLVIGTERHESRRIDNQLRGRAGRQGDPGMSQFYLSLNDPLLKIFGGDNLKTLMQNLQMTDMPLESTIFSNSLNSAQQKVEGFYYDQRKNLNKYDKVLNSQRELIYKFRQNVLKSENLRDLSIELADALTSELVDLIYEFPTLNSSGLRSIFIMLELPIDIFNSTLINKISKENLKSFLYRCIRSNYMRKEMLFWYHYQTFWRQYEKLVILKHIDYHWARHLEKMELLKDSIRWESYAQKDPFLQYEEKGRNLLSSTLKDCRDTIIYELFSVALYL